MKHDDLALKTMSFGVKKHEPPSQGFPENTTGLPRRNTTDNLRGIARQEKDDKKPSSAVHAITLPNSRKPFR
ncbi:MAG TPA: hypothetical protein VE954_33265 [Oligoflexus sp.]|uniref:hypothetical protein n=1 Tax=Oligoflexus sp. TaxID=1971216 RepID=UPI002D2DBA63|nr:hypothetical protein [Oligoflexus sp.]HYX37997.1 hypothetical protein [Oligoflexus sp.]